MTLREQLLVPATWSAADGPRSLFAQVLAPGRDTPVWLGALVLLLMLIAFGDAAASDVSEGTYGKLVVLTAASAFAVGRVGSRLVLARRTDA